MVAKLPAEVLGGFRSSREYDKTAGFFINAMHRDDGPTIINDAMQKIDESFRQELLSARPELGRFAAMPHGGQTGRFFHDQDMFVLQSNNNAIGNN
jgi:hypothetical protein